jgi:hypothetical protein
MTSNKKIKHAMLGQEELLRELYKFVKEKLQTKKDIKRVQLINDSQNAKNPLGQTGYYDPSEKTIGLYITGRHPKDILRSFVHEMVHHDQYCSGRFEDKHLGEMSSDYFLNNKHMREMEREAFERGNMIFREWTEYKRKKK